MPWLSLTNGDGAVDLVTNGSNGAIVFLSNGFDPANGPRYIIQ